MPNKKLPTPIPSVMRAPTTLQVAADVIASHEPDDPMVESYVLKMLLITIRDSVDEAMRLLDKQRSWIQEHRGEIANG